MNIKEFMGEQKGKIEPFTIACIGKTKEEKRLLEQQMLKPAILPPFSKKKKISSAIENRTVRLVFSDKDSFNLFTKHFSILKAGGNNIRNLDLLIAVLQELESGRMQYESSTGKITFINL